MAVKLNFNSALVDLSMGAGGKAMNRLIDQLMRKAFANEYLAQNEDQAILPKLNGKLAFTTDSFVVSPYFFPGGDIGSLAVYGTVNDLCMSGAKALYISVGFILEEGLPLKDLKKIVYSMADAAKTAGVKIVTGDTKVVEKGKGDGIFINTSGVGVIDQNASVSHQKVQGGDKIIINGNIAEHGVAVMSKRANLDFMTDVVSDAIALNGLVEHLLSQNLNIKMMRDPTRGGIAATLNEWADKYHCSIVVDEATLPISQEVESACELLGLDPLFIANEGKLLIVCSNEDSQSILAHLRKHPLGGNAQIIAEISDTKTQGVQMKTAFGGMRRVDWLTGEQLPRIC
ncbi:hydrogenase expression/formation protein HypE [Fangia hongkongensis]|uniref:hydrogenase expression/formation protein HypE n=1 Tax=Fangia hongkongensis TaxID=270495 RepID=UPI0003604BDC|nr:hydrogenase expression/formation protein HypE [Fangia hongkongensis]MBK2125204.1 hydrogenase expression/formation protein HypE [Fangia hongkongensis]